jgi:16S rRNA (cytidine1402-2'-O)-methyltransferase
MTTGTLYVVALPIGQIGDLSPRAKEILGSVELVLAEDTRRAGMLLGSFGIKKRLLSYHDHNEAGRAEQVIKELSSGINAAVITDAGTPCISDPGYRIIKICHEHNIPVRPIPGPSALVAALSVAGLPTDRFVFEGFLPPKGAKRSKRIDEILSRPMTSVIYESTHRIEKLLSEMAQKSPERLIFIGREMTKTYEEFLRGAAVDIAKEAQKRGELKGELVVVVEGAIKKENKKKNKYARDNDETQNEEHESDEE